MSAVQAISPEHKNIVAPKPLRDIEGWLIWRFEQYVGELKPRKIPFYANGGRRKGHQGSAVDRASLVTFEVARDAAVKRGFDGVGFAPLEGFGITALDFDNCVGEKGALPEIVKHVASKTYCEMSPSGKGVRAFLLGDLGNHKSSSKNGQFGFETFSTSGFVTLTGNALDSVELLGLEDTVAATDEKISHFCAERFGPDRATTGVVGDDPFAGTEKPIGLTIEQMEGYLACIDPDIGREDWIKVGMALAFECQGDDTGFALWNDWSEKGAKYPSEEALKAQWESFSRPRPAGRRPVTMATVIRLAKQGAQASGPAQAATADELHAASADTPAGDPKGSVATGPDFTGKYPIASAKAMSQRPPGDWLIKGVIPQADVVVLFGASGSGKSFVALDMAAAIAQGTPWREHRSKKGRVLIIAAEGGGGVGKRIQAYAQHHNLKVEDLDIGVIVASPNFLQKDEIIEVAAAIKNCGGVDLIIADTFAQVTAGANENAGEDMGLALGNAKALKETTGATVMLIHHAGKDLTRGARGWSGIKAAADAQIEIIKYEQGGREIRIDKMKDGDDGLQWGFKLEIIKTGVDKDGDDITSCVAVEADVPTPPVEEEERRNVKNYTAMESHVLRVIDELVDTSLTQVELKEFENICIAALPPVEEGKRDTRKNQVFNAITNLGKGREPRIKLAHGFVVFQ